MYVSHEVPRTGTGTQNGLLNNINVMSIMNERRLVLLSPRRKQGTVFSKTLADKLDRVCRAVNAIQFLSYVAQP